jgi:hypothetical protein
VKRLWYSEPVRNCRRVSPPPWPAAVFLFFLLAAEAFAWRLGVPGLAVRPPEVGIPAILVLGLGTTFYGIYRVFGFHPNLRPRYREWLRITAWHSPQRLPLGPVTLTLMDGILLLVATALLWARHPTIPPLRAALIFSVSYLLSMAFALLTSGPRGFGYAVLFGIGGILMAASDLVLGIGIALTTYFVAWGGLRLALINLREVDTKSIERYFLRVAPRGIRAAEISTVFVGWPFGYLGPNRTLPHASAFDVVCLAGLAGWLLASFRVFFCYVVGPGVTDEDLRLLGCLAYVGATMACGLRMLVFWINHRPPISVLGRLATFRWVIPSYDRAFAAPLAGMLVLWGFADLVLLRRGPPSLAGVSLLLTVALLVAFLPGPSLRTWALTSECRIVAQKPPAQLER